MIQCLCKFCGKTHDIEDYVICDRNIGFSQVNNRLIWQDTISFQCIECSKITAISIQTSIVHNKV